MAVRLATLSKGDRVPSVHIDLSRDWVAEYVATVEDASITALGDFAPPMALATLSVRALLEQAKLPQGAIHAGQELVFGPAVRIGTPHSAAAIVKSRGERSGWVLMNVHHEVLDQDHEQVMVGSALLAFPAPGATSTSNSVPSPTGDGVRQAVEGTRLPAVVRTLTQQKIDRYAKISGDRNPLHTDPTFAAATQFGGTVAHGMLVLAYISEMMTDAFGLDWLSGGRLKVRFRGAARPGDVVATSGHIIAVKEGHRAHPGAAPQKLTVCEVECRNQAGAALISGVAEVSAWSE